MIELEYVSVLVPKEEVERLYPGGLEAYCAEAPGGYLEDDFLTRVGFMAEDPAQSWIARLEELGLTRIALSGHPAPAWLETEGCLTWLSGTEPGELVRFEGLLKRGLAGRPEELHAKLAGICDGWEAVPDQLGGTRRRYFRANAQAEVETLSAPGGTGVVAELDRSRRTHLKEDFALVRAFRELLQ